LFEQGEMRDRVRTALERLPAREQRIIRLYYFEEATMKQIGTAIGVNESRVSQLHARAITRLRQALESPAAAPAPKRATRPVVVHRRRVAATTARPAAPARRKLRQVA